MDGIPGIKGTADLGIEIIDHIGVAKIADALGISKPAVRKWRQAGIPSDRQESLRNLLADMPAEVAPVQGPVASATRREKPAGKAMVALSAKPARLDSVTGKQAPHEIKVLIAKRDVDQARAFAEAAATKAEGLPPALPIRGYPIRLALLFALDFPILTMAFVAVTQASPIVAAGSAIALSLFLVLGAHALGGPLRELAMYLPAWLRHLATVIIMLVLLAAVIAVTVDLRIKGFDIDDLLLGASGGNAIFGDQASGPLTLPEPFRWAIARRGRAGDNHGNGFRDKLELSAARAADNLCPRRGCLPKGASTLCQRGEAPAGQSCCCRCCHGSRHHGHGGTG